MAHFFYLQLFADGTLNFDTKIDDDGFEKGIDGITGKAEGKLGKLGGILQTGLGVLTGNMMTKAIDTVKELGQEAINAGAELEQNIGGIETLFGAGGVNTLEEYAASVGKTTGEVSGRFDTLMEAQSIALANADKAYKTAGMSANEYMSTITGFAASLKQSTKDEVEAAQIADMAVQDMSDNANKMGTSMESIQNAYSGFAKQNYTMLDNLKLGYGGTKDEMARLLADAEKIHLETTGEATHYDINNLADVYNAIHDVQTELGITGTTANEAAETISGSLGAMKAAWENVLSYMATGQDVSGALNALVDSATTFFFDNFLPAVGNIASSIPGALSTLITAAIPKIVELGGELIRNLTEGFLSNVDQFINGGWYAINNFLLDARMQFPNVLAVGVEFLSNFINGMVDRLPELIKVAKQLTIMFLSFIANALPEIWKAGLSLIQKVGEGIIQNLPEIVKAAGELIGSLLAFIVSSLPKIVSSGIGIVLKLVAGLISAIPDIVAAIPKLIKAIVDGFANRDWGEVGHNVIEGIKDGILGGISAIADAARTAARKALDAAKDFLGIHSPSKVFKEQVGKNMALGMAEGFDDETENMSMSSIGGLITKANNVVGASTGNGITGYTGGGNRTIEVPVTIDGREVARATAEYMDTQMAWEG